MVTTLGVGPAGAQTVLVGNADLGLYDLSPIGPMSVDGTISLQGDYGGPAFDGWLCHADRMTGGVGSYQGSPTCSDSTSGSEGPTVPLPSAYGAMPSSFTATMTIQVSGATWQLDAATGWATVHCSGVINPISAGGGFQELQGACTAS